MINIFFTRRALSLIEFLNAAAKSGLLDIQALDGGVKRTKGGKPYIDGAPHFSYSNTDGASAFCIGSQNMGIDIENKSRAVPKRVSQRFFADTKRERLLHDWTAAEAFVKYSDLPLLGVLQSFKVLDGKIYYKGKEQGVNLFYAETDGFLIAAAAAGNDFRVTIL